MPRNSTPVADDTAPTPWRERLEAALADDAPVDSGALPDARRARHAPRRAAVLIAVEAARVPRIIFTQRSASLTHHPGQISFPGGRIEPGDTGPAAAALRECREEIGLAPSSVTFLGELSRYCTVTGFDINPFVGWVAPGQTLVPDGVEIERIFTVPLDYAMDITRYRSESHRRDGVDYRIHSIDFDGQHIWGATAAMLLDLVRRVARVPGRV